MSTLKDAYHPDNIARAWRWIRSNPDAEYKSYHRESYGVYAIGDQAAIGDLRKRLVRSAFAPHHSCKIYLPKKSGVLRPYTLMTVEDQIVYQAMVNVVAEKFYPRVRSRYYLETFGHLYAGKASVWFYRKWSDGYRKFNDSVRQAFNAGLKFTASFDLTACYDSLDHGVLTHFLKKLGCDDDFCRVFMDNLRHWAATDERIYHNHGIPQGPLGSGLLAEVVLQHFDALRGSPNRIRYLRYVDDIRLLAKTPRDLRRMLVRLDKLSKDIGVFPQSSKIEIHEIKNVDDELKSVSAPPEVVVRARIVNQKKLRRRLTQLSRKWEVTNPTRWKYLLAHATPSAELSRRLRRIYDRQPSFYPQIMRYLRQYKRLPKDVTDWLIAELKVEQHPYPSIHTAMLLTLEGRITLAQANAVDPIVRRGLRRRTSLQADLLAAMGCWALRRNLLTFAQVRALLSSKGQWWARTRLLSAIDGQHIGQPSFGSLINERLRDNVGDVASTAAVVAAAKNISIDPPQNTVHPQGGRTLRALGVVKRVRGGVCGVRENMNRLLGSRVALIRWKRMFGQHHRQAEMQAAWCRAYADTDITACVNAADVLNDLLLDSLYAYDTSLGTYTLGQVGAVLNSKRLKSTYPDFLALVQSVHNRRLESHLSHAKVRKTGKRTGRIGYRYLSVAKRLMAKGYLEVDRKW